MEQDTGWTSEGDVSYHSAPRPLCKTDSNKSCCHLCPQGYCSTQSIQRPKYLTKPTPDRLGVYPTVPLSLASSDVSKTMVTLEEEQDDPGLPGFNQTSIQSCYLSQNN